MKRLALISVTDKQGVETFAKGLIAKNFDILSTGKTAAYLREHGVEVTDVSYYTSMPEILDGRVKTLHPKIHAGLLAKPTDEAHRQQMDELNIRPIEVLAVNLYPFEQTVLSNAPFDEVIENIDIGGPAMIRAAAKNAANVLVIVDPTDYPVVLETIDKPTDALRKSLQAKAFAHTAFYDSIISNYLQKDDAFEQPGQTLTLGYRLVQPLRYGENPHQKAGLFVRPVDATKGIVSAKQVWGKELSYNNILDAESAWELACDVQGVVGPAKRPCIIVKHGNPCGCAWAETVTASFDAAKAGDPVSAFGGIVAVPGRLTAQDTARLAEKGNFFEVIICGSITDDGLTVLRERSGWGKDVRVLVAGPPPKGAYLSIRGLRGGALIQTADTEDPIEWRCVTTRKPTPAEDDALRVAWTIVKHVKSNAIVVAGSDSLLGVGAGQMNRVTSVRLALAQAAGRARGAVLASDAFFPFPDSIEEAAKAGIAAVVQPGGSKRDEEVIQAANALGVAIVLTGVRHFRH